MQDALLCTGIWTLVHLIRLPSHILPRRLRRRRWLWTAPAESQGASLPALRWTEIRQDAVDRWVLSIALFVIRQGPLASDVVDERQPPL